MSRLSLQRSAFYVLIGVLMAYGTAESHAGPTDSLGCHMNNKTGSYHCHGTNYNRGQGAGSYTPPAYLMTPACPATQHFSHAKNECVCGAGKVKNDEDMCVCRAGFISNGASCARLPGHAKEDPKKPGSWVCVMGYQKKGNSCVNLKVTHSSGFTRFGAMILRPRSR